MTRREYLPWRVRTTGFAEGEKRHHKWKEAQYLRELLKRDAGVDPIPSMLARAESWVQRELEPDDLVVTYDPRVGFGYVPRKPGDGKYHRPPVDPELRAPRPRMIDVRTQNEKESDRDKRIERLEALVRELTEKLNA